MESEDVLEGDTVIRHFTIGERQLSEERQLATVLRIQIWDPGSGIQDLGSGIWDPGSEIWDLGSMDGKISGHGTRDKHPGLNIPDPQHCLADTLHTTGI
jgi:hypothetical protein